MVQTGRKVVRINFFAGPSAGKSTLAASTFARLKKSKIENVELVNEWIKGWAWEGKVPTSFDQLYVFAKQLRLEDRILRLGTSIVTDSPLLMQIVYARKYVPEIELPLRQLFRLFEDRYPSLNILVERQHEYVSVGRYESESEARQLDVDIEELLLEERLSYVKSGVFEDFDLVTFLKEHSA